MAPSRPFGRGGFTTLDRRKETAQSMLARAWRSCVARRCLALRLDEARLQQQRMLVLEQKRAVAERLAAERRATTAVRKKKTPQPGLQLKQLVGVLPGSGTWSPLYSTSPRNENRVNENHLGICLSFSQKNRN